ncbi:uncharacterized protein LOC135165610 [Diachasmimorpha longicaudata]|uniref:uncharacterized protein LOC135165610 n=1 Tax=Diachasmimorpha longicaudata TaxID=58733 RepID=UPI0030B8E47F
MQCLLLLTQVFGLYFNSADAGPAKEVIVVKKCAVNGTTYSHGQTVSSRDPNCHCLCVAGDVYCWWENYKARMISSDGSTIVPGEIELSQPVFVDRVGVKGNANSNVKGVDRNDTFSRHVSCFIMGKEYQVGEVLPHSTGNCVECSCGREGRVECSPRDCIALRPLDISVVSPNLDHDTPENQIELFGISRERGIDENF